MYTLYVRSSCPFCVRVMEAIEEQKIPIELKETTDEGVADELIAHGGKNQVPYLIDDTSGVAMYESQDIIAYLTARNSESKGGNKRSDQDDTVHITARTGNVCPVEDPK